MNFKSVERLLIAVACVCAFPGDALTQRASRLQVLVTSSEEKAGSTVERLNALGLGPAETRTSGTLYKVVTREFPSVAEANLAKPLVHSSGFQDAFAVFEAVSPGDEVTTATIFGDNFSITQQDAFEQLRYDFDATPRDRLWPTITPEQEAMDNWTIGERQLFSKAMGYYQDSHTTAALLTLDVFRSRFEQSNRIPRVMLMQGYWLIRRGDLDVAKLSFAAVYQQYPHLPEAGEAVLRIGYLNLKAKADSEAFRCFRAVAAGTVPAEQKVRAESMLRTAAMYHRAKDLDAAELAYSLIGSITPDQEVQAFAQMQRAGLLMEKAWNGKATFAQCREVCDNLLAQYTDVTTRTRATASLMALETLIYEKNYRGVLDREMAFSSEFGGTSEAPLGYYWISQALLKTGDAESAATLLETIIAANIRTEDRFKYVNLTPTAKRLAAKAYRQTGNLQREQELLDSIRRD